MARPLDARAAEELRKLIIALLSIPRAEDLQHDQGRLWTSVMRFHETPLTRDIIRVIHLPTVSRIKKLSKAAGGWWYFPEHRSSKDAFGEGRFVTIGEWLMIYAQGQMSEDG